MTPIQYAIYSRGALEVPTASLFTFNIALLLMPTLVKLYQNNNSAEIHNVLTFEYKRLFIILIPLFFSFLLINKELIIFLYSVEYIDSIPIFSIYLLLIPFQFYPFNTVLQAMNSTKWVFIFSVFTLILNIVVSIVLIKTIGIIGPAIGTIGSVFVSNYLYLLVINKKLNVPFKEWLPWKTLFSVISLCVILFCLFWSVKYFCLDSFFLLKIILLPIFFLAEIIILWKTNLIEQQDKQKVISIILVILEKLRITKHKVVS